VIYSRIILGGRSEFGKQGMDIRESDSRNWVVNSVNEGP
jgi:hypothetical protein